MSEQVSLLTPSPPFKTGSETFSSCQRPTGLSEWERMKRRSYRRKKLTKFADTHGLLAFKVLLIVLTVVGAGVLTYLVSRPAGGF